MKNCIICKTVLDDKKKKKYCSSECRETHLKAKRKQWYKTHKEENKQKCYEWKAKNIEHFRKYQRDYQRTVYLKNKGNLQKHKIRVMLRAALNHFDDKEKSKSSVWQFINSSPEKTVKHLTKNGKHWNNAIISNKIKRIPVKTVKEANKVFYYKNLKLV